jgi:hypothetical protein
MESEVSNRVHDRLPLDSVLPHSANLLFNICFNIIILLTQSSDFTSGFGRIILKHMNIGGLRALDRAATVIGNSSFFRLSFCQSFSPTDQIKDCNFLKVKVKR